MEIITLNPQNPTKELIFKIDSYKVYAKFDINNNTLKSIEVNIENPEALNYDFISINLCKNYIHQNLDYHVLELHIRESSNPQNNSDPIIKIINQEIRNGTTIITTGIIYEFDDLVKECYYPRFDGQPETKDGAIIVSI